MTFDQAIALLADEESGRKDWLEIAKAAESSDLQSFFSLYADYLEMNGLSGADRVVLHTMCRRAADRLSPSVSQLAPRETQLEFDFGEEL